MTVKSSLAILTECWNVANQRWFGGELTPVPIVAGGPSKAHGAFYPNQMKIKINLRHLARFDDPAVRDQAIATLVHEMIHQQIHADGFPDEHHGSRFTAKCNKIGAELGIPEVRCRASKQHRPSRFWPGDANNRAIAAVIESALPEPTEPEPGDRVPDIGTWAPPSNPMAVAREIVTNYQNADGTLKLRRWRGTWMTWQQTHWSETEDIAVRKELYGRLENAEYDDAEGLPKPWAPNKTKIANVLDALMAITYLPETVNPPTWSGRERPAPSDEIVACTNGLLHVGTRKLIDHTPAYFNTVSVPFAYDPEAPDPAKWVKFLEELWPDDKEAVSALQEFFGYVISGRTDLHKILLLIGPSRSGKGTIARILSALIGNGNVAGPTLGTLAGQFGLQSLLGKPLAVIPDARVAGASQALVVEKLLSISGEDSIDVDRKFRDPWTGKLPTRLMMLSNELPRFGDASGAISSRFVILMTTRSFLGSENSRLTGELLTELPGILKWSLDGLDRLVANGALTEPKSSADARTALQDTVSPMSAFVREECERGGRVPVDVMFAAWKSWCEDNNIKAASKQVFGKDLRAVVPLLRTSQPRDENGSNKTRYYVGVSLRSSSRNNEDRVSARVSEDGDTLTRADTRPNALWAQHQSTPHCIACGNPMTVIKPGWYFHPECEPTENQ